MYLFFFLRYGKPNGECRCDFFSVRSDSPIVDCKNEYQEKKSNEPSADGNVSRATAAASGASRGHKKKKTENNTNSANFVFFWVGGWGFFLSFGCVVVCVAIVL